MFCAENASYHWQVLRRVGLSDSSWFDELDHGYSTIVFDLLKLCGWNSVPH